jgi:hypothetical protein
MISTIHDATLGNTGRKDRKTKKEPLRCCPAQYIHEWRGKGRPLPQLLLNFEENCQMVEKAGIVSAKLCTAQCIFLGTEH